MIYVFDFDIHGQNFRLTFYGNIITYFYKNVNNNFIPNKKIKAAEKL